MGWPDPATSRSASSSTWASTTAAKERSSRARSPGATPRQATWAAAAAAIASSACSAEAWVTVVTGSSVAGLSTVKTDMGGLPPLKALEGAPQLPVGHRRVVGGQLDPSVVGVVLHHLLAERLAGQLALLPQLQGVTQSTRDRDRRVVVGVAGHRGLERQLAVDAVQPGGDHRRHRQVGVHV